MMVITGRDCRFVFQWCENGTCVFSELAPAAMGKTPWTLPAVAPSAAGRGPGLAPSVAAPLSLGGLFQDC